MTPVFDYHDEAYYRWRDAGVRGATLVHVDAHHDLETGPASGVVHIGNFVRAAMAEGIVSRLIWVLPQPMWDDPATRAVAVHDLETLCPHGEASLAPLGATPGSQEPVLLDVDLDYLFTVAFDRDPARATRPEPWCDVETLARELVARWPSRQVTTIATSLTGGFTPMHGKHLGRALAAAIDGAPLAAGWDTPARDFAEAERLQGVGETGAARAAFARAVAADPEYRHPFRTHGHLHRQAGRSAEAARAFRAAIDLDPADGWARLGLAMMDVEAGQCDAALAWLGDLDPGDGRVDAWRALRDARAGLDDVRGAITAGRRVLSLALAGAVPLSLWSSNRDRRLVDPAHFNDHARLASLHRRAGEPAAAAAHQRIADAGGMRLEEYV